MSTYRKYPQGYYVYAYIRKSNGTPYYIGKGKGNRAWSNRHNVIVPKDLSKIIIIAEDLLELWALALERRLIRWYGRKDLDYPGQPAGILYNRTDGGENGGSMSEQTRSKIRKARAKQIFSSESHRKRADALRGRKRPKEIGEKISKAKKGRLINSIPWNKGKFMTIETSIKLSKSLRDGYKNGRKLSSTTFKKGCTPHNVGEKVYFFEKDGAIYQTDNLTKFSNEYNLRSDSLGHIYKDNSSYRSHRGWRKANNTEVIHYIKMYHI